MVRNVDIITFNYALKPDTVLRGQFMTRIGADDWAAIDNDDGVPMVFRGSFRDVIENFIPYNGETIVVDHILLGIKRTENGFERHELRERRKNKHTTQILCARMTE